MDAVPVTLDRRRQTMNRINGYANRPRAARKVRDADFSRTVYYGEIRPRVVERAMEWNM